MVIRPEKLVITSNFYPAQCFTHKEDMAPILRRFRVVEDLATLPPIPDQEPLEFLEPLVAEEVPQEPGEEELAPGEVREGMGEEMGVREGMGMREGEGVRKDVGVRKEPPRKKKSLEPEVSQEGGAQVSEEEDDDLPEQMDDRCKQQ